MEKEMTNQIDKAITELAKQHIPVQVIECSCWHGNEDVHEKMVVGYACSYCCETSEDGKTAWCDDNHAGKPYHDTEEPWGAFYCPVINLLQEIRDGVK
jgi:hypothetical protein